MDSTFNITPELHRAMLAFALLNLRSEADAQDVVQDAILVLIESPERFTDVDDPKRYLFGVLKYKIADWFRKPSRAHVSKDALTDTDFDQLLFDHADHWREGVAPSLWRTADREMESSQFFSVVDICVNHLPEKCGRVFSMKEFLDFDADEVCLHLSISKTDYWQCMSRARKQLQICLNKNWFGDETL